MIGCFTFAGKNSRDYGVYITGNKSFGCPAREHEDISIPGRNGTLHIDRKRFQDAKVTYECAIIQNFNANIEALRALLMSQSGYARLEDTYHPEAYRMAMLSGGINPTPGPRNRTGAFTLEFDCKPQRFLKLGEIPQTLTAPQTLYNPGMEALPLITVYGSGAGTVTVGGVTVDIKSLDEYLILDCDTQNAYKGILENKNNTIYAPKFPTIPPGESRVAWTGGVERVEIVPRWWIL